MKYFISGLIGFVICFILLVVIKGYNNDVQLVIQTNNIIQHQTNTKYIRIPYEVSKTNIYTNYLSMLDELNKYLTEPGWIRHSDNQIFAGLYQRTWSVPYSVFRPNYKHSVGVLVGEGLLIDYRYQLLERVSIRGGLLSKDDKANLMFGADYKF